MASVRAFYHKVLKGVTGIQRMFRLWKLRRFFMNIKDEIKKRAVLLLQRHLKGYIQYNKYFARLKGTITNKNLDYIIEKHADAKAFLLESLQIKLAYLGRKLIKRKKKEAAEKKKMALKAKKKALKLKELEKLRKIHEDRKAKKRQVRKVLKEAVDLFYDKED